MRAGKENSQLGRREGLNPRAAQPAASSANHAANLILCTTGSCPHSIPHSRAAPRQLGSVTSMAPKSTQEDVGDTHSALLAQHLMLAGTEQVVAQPKSCAGSFPRPLIRPRRSSPGHPSSSSRWARGRLRKGLREVWRMQGRQTKGELQIAGVWKTLQPRVRQRCGQPGGSEPGAAVPCLCKGWSVQLHGGQTSPRTIGGLRSRTSPVEHAAAPAGS